ncbi:MAG: peptide-methionine (S)-S-oxide reductase MsrA [Rickettsiales bacterium]|nr:peptide-methionine (S)-S-oxide reductase MsrA [Rickettsiales bacterium]
MGLLFSGASNANETSKQEQATFAGGCFWCMQPIFDELEGVIKTEVGYSGGKSKNPTYDEISTGNSGHQEVIQITFDPNKISYEFLLDKFMRNIDPIDPLGQFYDKGSQYVTSVFYHNETQKKITEEYFEKLRKSKILKGEIAVTIKAFQAFYAAEDYHQKYYEKNSIRYNLYKKGSGREEKIKQIWNEK